MHKTNAHKSGIITPIFGHLLLCVILAFAYVHCFYFNIVKPSSFTPIHFDQSLSPCDSRCTATKTSVYLIGGMQYLLQELLPDVQLKHSVPTVQYTLKNL